MGLLPNIVSETAREVFKDLPRVPQGLLEEGLKAWEKASGHSAGRAVSDLHLTRKLGDTTEHIFPNGTQHMSDNNSWMTSITDGRSWLRKATGEEVSRYPDGGKVIRLTTGDNIIDGQYFPQRRYSPIGIDSALPIAPGDVIRIGQPQTLDRSVTMLNDGTLLVNRPDSQGLILRPGQEIQATMPLSHATFRDPYTGIEATHVSNGVKLLVTPTGESAIKDLNGAVSVANLFTGRQRHVFDAHRVDLWKNGLRINENGVGALRVESDIHNFVVSFDGSGNRTTPGMLLERTNNSTTPLPRFFERESPTSWRTRFSNGMSTLEHPDGSVTLRDKANNTLFSVSGEGLISELALH